jgi:serine/threonine-protein kinase
VVLEFIDGPSAQTLLDRIGRLDIGDVVHIGISIAMALNHLHRQKYVHRDIKPDNILLSPSGEAKLIDFGLVKWIAKDAGKLTMACDGFGTSYYMPYEQCLNAHLVDCRSDIFALGAALYHLATGRVPFAGEDHGDIMRMKQAGHFTPPSLLNPKVPPSLQAVLTRMLAASPTDRYQTASDAYVALKRTKLANDCPRFAALGLAVRDPSQPVRPTSEATRPDLRLRASRLRKSRTQHLWYVRYRDGAGRLRLCKATTKQVFRALRIGSLKGEVEATRQRESFFRPLAEFPEFQSYFGEMPATTSTPLPVSRPSKRAQRCWYRRMLISLGFALFVLGVASVFSFVNSVLHHV